jgi:hypothetical protein
MRADFMQRACGNQHFLAEKHRAARAARVAMRGRGVV